MLALEVLRATHEVVVDHSCGLHMRIDGGWADEFKPEFFEVLGNLGGQGS